MALSLESLTLAKKYVDESLVGVGAIKGSPCEIKQENFDNEGNTIITFYWVDKDNKEYTKDVIVNRGKKGDQGYTPVRGTDYWTSADIAQIQAYVDEQIGGALNGTY